MPFRVSGKNLDLGEALRKRIGVRIAETLGKYFDGGYSGHVTLAKDGFGFRTECAIHLDSKITLHAEGMAPDAMPVPIKRRCGSKNDCADITAGSRSTVPSELRQKLPLMLQAMSSRRRDTTMKRRPAISRRSSLPNQRRR